MYSDLQSHTDITFNWPGTGLGLKTTRYDYSVSLNNNNINIISMNFNRLNNIPGTCSSTSFIVWLSYQAVRDALLRISSATAKQYLMKMNKELHCLLHFEKLKQCLIITTVHPLWMQYWLQCFKHVCTLIIK